MRKKNSPFRMFIRGFIKSFFIVAILFLVGFGSYKLTMLYYEAAEPPKNERVDELVNNITSNGVVEDVSKNLIFAVKPKTGEVTHLLLEVFNTYTYNMDYITIPAKTQFTLSNESYQKLCAQNPDIPQIIRLSDLYKYFDGNSTYEYGVFILEDLLDVKVSYYTQMEESYFSKIFSENKEKAAFSPEMLSNIANLTTEEEIKTYVKEFCDNISSNLSTKEKLKYVTPYGKVSLESVYFHAIVGKSTNSGYNLDVTAADQLLTDIILNDTPYKEKQENEPVGTKDGVSSKGHVIQILNGSKISGLAAAYNTKLTDEGYTIKGIGNYSGEIVVKTKIIVRSPELGKDLADYFNDPEVVTETLPEGIDIQIILGSADKES